MNHRDKEESKDGNVMWYISGMVRPLKAHCLVFLLCLVLFAAAGCTTVNSPRRSLDEMRTALLNHDADGALRYIDMDSVVENMVNDIFTKYEAKAENPLELVGVKAGRQTAWLLTPMLKELARNRVKAAINSPDEGGYFEYVKKGSVWYLEVSQDGDTAVVKPISLIKSDISFTMKRMKDGHWSIVHIMKE